MSSPPEVTIGGLVGTRWKPALSVEVSDGIAVVTFDLPNESVNKLNRAVKDEFVALVSQLERDTTVHAAVLISGKPDVWIAGADIEEFQELKTAADAERLSRDGQMLLDSLERLRVPIVAAIHGACLGGGLETALACRYRIATDHPKTILGLPEVQLGLIPGAGGTQRLPRKIGLTNGLAYTNYGGAILECEVAVVPGKGKLVITGLLEKGMQESAQAAMSYIRSREKLLGLPNDFYQNSDFHIHFPEFVPKDGPSAGVTMATSIASALMRIPVRRNLAMTGEITLRGRIMPIGGLKEKALAAHRAGIHTLLIPKDNRKDLREIPRRVLSATRIVLIEHADEALREALCLSDPEAMFGKRVAPMEYVNGRLLTNGQPVPADDDDEPETGVPTPTVDAPGAQQ